jgi:hypothetical protein
MAISKTTELQRCEVYPDGRLMVVYIDSFDDPDDDLLPTSSNRVIHLAPHADVTAHMALVQDIAAGAWTNIPAPVEDTPVE